MFAIACFAYAIKYRYLIFISARFTPYRGITICFVNFTIKHTKPANYTMAKTTNDKMTCILIKIQSIACLKLFQTCAPQCRFGIMIQLLPSYKANIKESIISLVWFMMLKATFNNISVASQRSVLLVEETGVPAENHQPVAIHWKTLSHNIVSSTHCHKWGSKSQFYF